MNPNALTLEIETPGAPEGIEHLMEVVACAALQLEGVTAAEVAARLVDDEAIHQINRETRGVDRATDVLSFPTISYPAGKTARDCPKRLKREYNPATGRCFLGDLVLSMPRAADQALAYGHSLSREIGFLTAHGVLHLMGYDHETEDGTKKMRMLEEQTLASLSLLR